MKRRSGSMKVMNQSTWIPDFPVCISFSHSNISLSLQDAKKLANQLNKVIKDIEKK
jgi:hypothetical protein